VFVIRFPFLLQLAPAKGDFFSLIERQIPPLVEQAPPDRARHLPRALRVCQCYVMGGSDALLALPVGAQVILFTNGRGNADPSRPSSPKIIKRARGVRD
jgi:hypothetical protein